MPDRPVAKVKWGASDRGLAGLSRRTLWMWSQEQSDSAYLNTLHISKTPLDTFSFAAKAKLYCIVYQRGENWGRARFTVGDTVTELDQANPYLRSNVPSCLTFSTRHLRTATVEVLNGVINLDGVYFE